MNKSIGFVEYRSIARGIEATDAMLKSGKVTLIYATVLCPGKYVIMLTGDVGAVKNAVKTGSEYDPMAFIDSTVIPNIHESILPALTGTVPAVMSGAVGIVETIDVCSSIVAADKAAKAGSVTLLEIRIARGMGGKGMFILCGDVAAVKSAVTAATQEIADQGTLIATSVIPSPHEELVI